MLAAQTTLPMKLRLFWWERGLKDEIRTMCSVDPLTHKQYADIEAAQNAVGWEQLTLHVHQICFRQGILQTASQGARQIQSQNQQQQREQ